MDKTEKKFRRLLVLSVFLATGVFVVDLLIPLGVAGGVPYVALVLVSLWSPQKKHTIIAAIAGTVLTILGFFFSPAGGITWMVLVNRFLALFAIWVTAMLSLQRKQIEEALRQGKEELRKHGDHLDKMVKVRTAKLSILNEELQRKIEERKQAEETLEESEKFTSSLLENSLIPILVVNQDTSIKYVNPILEELTGYSSEEIIGKKAPYPWWIVDPESGNVNERIKNIRTGVRGLERLFQKKNGEQFWVELSTTPIKRNGDFKYALTNWVDITEHKRSAEALRENEEKHRQLFATVSDAIMVFDAETKQFLDVNDAVLRLYDYSREDFLKLRQPDITAEPQNSRESLNQTLSGDLSKIPLRYHKKRDGTIFPVEISVGAFKLGNRRLIFGVVRDITERKKAEEERKQLEAQLQQSQKMEAIGTLAGGIAHDFNNILGIIVGHTELAMDDVPEGNQACHNLEEIRTACLRARDMVKQILAFGRQSKPELKPVKISQIIKETLKLLRSSIPTTVEIHENISGKSDTVNADPSQISQVLLNLCTNSAHAMRGNGGILNVSLEDMILDEAAMTRHHGLRPGKYVKLSVSDTGHGIEPEIMERIFDPYFTTKEVGDGTGMGLSVVHGIIKNHGGAISVNSEPRKGTTFQIFLPIIESDVKQDFETVRELPKGNERILFVDDEKAMVDAVQPMLERLGYQLTARTSSIEALEAFRNKPDTFDLVITDQTMPNMTGIDLTKELQRIRPDIPVILCTGYSEMINEDNTREMGISAFAMKPLIKSEIAKTIRKVIDERERSSTMAHILIIEDDDQMRVMLREMFERSGYKVVEAPNGKEGIKLFREDPADLIITDIIMPEKEGIETIIELRRDFPDVKIIAISGGGRIGPEDYLHMAEKLGVQYTLAKPFDREALLKAVRDLMG